MSEEIITRGKNLKEAIGIGLELMEVKKSQVDIEIIQNEEKGFMGIFGKKQAVVRLVKRKAVKELNTKDFSLESEVLKVGTTEDCQIETKDLTDEKNQSNGLLGKVWVKDGEIFCKESFTHYPTITPGKGISLYKNGELVKKTTVLTENDVIKVDLPSEEKETSWSIHLDSRKMSATILVDPGYHREYRLMDQDPSSHIHLKIHAQEMIINNLQLSEIEDRIKELGINTGIQSSEIQNAMQAKESAKFTIAKGIPPQKGEDGWLESKVDTELKKNGPKLLENGEIDYRELITFPNVEIGQLIGIIHPPKPGIPGITITGEEVQPSVSRKMGVTVQRGIELIEQGSKIIATENGRPYIEFRGNLKARVSVIPRLVHSADVDIASGNLRYLGDIEVRGNVREGMTLGAVKDILVYGTVEKATLVAGNQIMICKNVFNSQLIAGKGHQLVKEIADLMGTLSTQLNGLASAVKQVYQSPIFKTSDIAKMGLTSLIRILLENKFKTLPPLVKELCELIEKADKLQILDQEYREIRSLLINGFIKMRPRQFSHPDDIMDLLMKMEEIQDLTASSGESDASITLPYALNSEIVCSGDISIIGKGSINSNINSGGKVKINGVLRGGEIYAEMGVEAEEAGAVGDMATRIRVPDGQSIRIHNALEGTTIQIGRHSHQFASSVQNVFARVSEEDRLLLF